MKETCVVFTKNRHSTLEEIIEIYSCYFKSIIVLDGSDQGKHTAIKKTIKKLRLFLDKGSGSNQAPKTSLNTSG